MNLISLYVTYPDDEFFKLVARTAVNLKLAACVNAGLPCRSFYQWRGKTFEDAECVCLFKTKCGKLKELKRFLEMSHPYEEPAILQYKIKSLSKPYSQWVEDQLA